jgi:hypothetical protein
MYQVNKNSKAVLQRVGHEQTPILVVDDFLVDINAVIAQGVIASYGTDKVVGSYYPGVRADVDTAYGMKVLQYAAYMLYQQFQVPENLTLYPKSGSFSLLTQQPEDMNLLQCIPHFDNNDTFSFAMIHYLNEGDFGGTGFYRHIPTGFENIIQSRKQQYLSAAQSFIDIHGNPERQYFTNTTTHYELIHKVDYKPNRLVLYPSTLLHSAHITNPENDVNPDPKTGRLSANFFIEFR